MAYNTRRLKTDLDQKPVPQYYNPVTDDYEVLQGEAGGNRVVLYGPNGEPIGPATETTLADVKRTLGVPESLPKTNIQKSRTAMEVLKGLTGLLIDDDTLPGPSRVAAIQSAVTALAGVEYARDGTVGAVGEAVDTIVGALGSTADAAAKSTDEVATAIALLKGLLELTAMRATDQTLTQIKTALTDGTQQVQLTGNYAQLPDVIATDTVITAGSNLIIKDGNQPFVLGAGKRGIAAGYSMGSPAKSKMAVVFYSETYPISAPLSTINLYDSGDSASVQGSGVMPIAHSSRYALRLFNTDTVDMIVKVLTCAEVS